MKGEKNQGERTKEPKDKTTTTKKLPPVMPVRKNAGGEGRTDEQKDPERADHREKKKAEKKSQTPT